MNPHSPHEHREPLTGVLRQPTMDTYAVRLPRWPILQRLLGRDPLVRTTDRVEALVSVLTVVVTLLAAPIAAAIGTEVYDSRRDVYAELASIPPHHGRDGHRRLLPPNETQVPTMITVQARWSAAGTEHTGAVEAQSTVEAGDSVEIWVDHDGVQVPAPIPTSRAAVAAVTVALVSLGRFRRRGGGSVHPHPGGLQPYPLHRMAKRPRQPGRPRRRTSASGPRLGRLTLLEATLGRPISARSKN